jgi:hypothetical protein
MPVVPGFQRGTMWCFRRAKTNPVRSISRGADVSCVPSPKFTFPTRQPSENNQIAHEQWYTAARKPRNSGLICNSPGIGVCALDLSFSLAFEMKDERMIYLR